MDAINCDESCITLKHMQLKNGAMSQTEKEYWKNYLSTKDTLTYSEKALVDKISYQNAAHKNTMNNFSVFMVLLTVIVLIITLKHWYDSCPFTLLKLLIVAIGGLSICIVVIFLFGVPPF